MEGGRDLWVDFGMVEELLMQKLNIEWLDECGNHYVGSCVQFADAQRHKAKFRRAVQCACHFLIDCLKLKNSCTSTRLALVQNNLKICCSSIRDP